MKSVMILLVLGVLIFSAFLVVIPSYQKQMNKAKDRIKSESRLLKTRFGVMEYAVTGHGKPVLLIHGAGGGFDQGLWLGRICLEGDYMFIAPSKFGYLNSQCPENYTAQLQSEQYRILLDALGIEKVSIIGVSAGGPSAMQFASDYPERTDKLVLVSAVSMPPNSNDKDPFFIKIIQTIQKSDFAYWLFTKTFKSQILDLMGIPAEDYKKFTREQKELANEMLEVMHPMSLRHSGTVTDGLIIKDFQMPDSIHVPTLVVHSRNDGLVSYSHAVHSSQRIKGSRFILYENGGHGVISELRDARKQISSFLHD